MAGFKALKGQGHAPTLFMAFLYFDMSFMVWTMLGPLSTEIGGSIGSCWSHDDGRRKSNTAFSSYSLWSHS